MTRLTDAELIHARERQDWATLWLAADPWIKFAMAELNCGDEDALQVGREAVGKAIRKWDPEKGAFSTHVKTQAHYALLNYLKEKMSGGIGSRRQAEIGQPNRFVSLDDPAEAGSSRSPADEINASWIDRLTYDDLDDSTDFEALMRSGQMQNAVDQMLRFIPDVDAQFFRSIARAGGCRALARAHNLPVSTVKDRLRAVVKKLSGHFAKFEYIRGTTLNRDYLGFATGKVYIQEAIGNPYADWSYKPTAEDLAKGAAPRNDGYPWSAGARRLLGLGVKK